jgi:hypothetical protein
MINVLWWTRIDWNLAQIWHIWHKSGTPDMTTTGGNNGIRQYPKTKVWKIPGSLHLPGAGV